MTDEIHQKSILTCQTKQAIFDDLKKMSQKLTRGQSDVVFSCCKHFNPSAVPSFFMLIKFFTLNLNESGAG
jgi:hypothetical protein